jgi:hypothetical protein
MILQLILSIALGILHEFLMKIVVFYFLIDNMEFGIWLKTYFFFFCIEDIICIIIFSLFYTLIIMNKPLSIYFDKKIKKK